MNSFTFPPTVSLSSMSSIYANIFLHDFLSDWSEMESQCNFDLLFFDAHEELHIFMCLLALCVSSFKNSFCFIILFIDWIV